MASTWSHTEPVPTARKVVGTLTEALSGVCDGSSLAVGGFGLCGVPFTLLAGVASSGARNLEVFSNNCGVDGAGLGLLLASHQVRRVTASYVGENKEFARQYLAGELEVELIPQGTLAERLRAGGCGIPAFYTPAGVGTAIAEGGIPWRYHRDGSVAVGSPPKEVRTFGGREFILEEAIVTDFALVQAAIADTAGNLVFNKTAMNFNPIAAMAGRLTICEAEQIVEAGEIPPADVHLPGVFVQRIFHAGSASKPIERRTTWQAAPSAAKESG